MAPELALHRQNLLKSNSYSGNDHLHSDFVWQSQKMGHILINETTNENAVLAVVGQVLEKGLQCASSGK